MSKDYSFYALLCGYMPRPEGVQKGKDESLSLFCFGAAVRGACNEWGLLVNVGAVSLISSVENEQRINISCTNSYIKISNINSVYNI